MRNAGPAICKLQESINNQDWCMATIMTYTSPAKIKTIPPTISYFHDLSPEKYPEEKIIAILKEVEAGAKVAETCRKYGISDATYYNWKTKYADLELSELKRLRALEEENNKLKRIVAEQALDIQALKYVIEKKY